MNEGDGNDDLAVVTNWPIPFTCGLPESMHLRSSQSASRISINIHLGKWIQQS